MKIEKEGTIALNTLSGKQTKFTIDEDGADFIIEALSKTIYKNPIGTLIREYVSNAYDANRENGIDDPVIVNIDKDASGDYLSVIDYGVGLSIDRINNIFCRYGKSTKRGDNDQIGGFGIGAKSGFAYTDTFFINTVHDKVLYKYILYKTEKVPQIQLLSQEETDQRNSTQVKIYIKDRDTSKFSNEIRLQLRYFDSVYVKSDSHYNEAVIVEKETFKYSKLVDSTNTFNKLHICLGKVAYPINFQLVGIKDIEFPFALKFEIGDLPVTLSREELQYDNETIRKIKAKIEDFKNEIEKIYLEENIFEYDNMFLREKFEMKNPCINLNNVDFIVSSLINKKTSVYTKKKDYNVPINVSSLFESKGSITAANGEIPRGYTYNLNNDIFTKRENLLVLMDVNRSSKEKTIFLFEEKGKFTPVYLKKNKYDWYRTTLQLNSSVRGRFGTKGAYINIGNVKRIQDFRMTLIEDFMEFGTLYSSITVTSDYKKKIQDEQKKKKDSEKEKIKLDLESKKTKGEIPAYEVTSKNLSVKRLYPITINIAWTKRAKNQSKAFKNLMSSKKYIYVEINRSQDIKELLKAYPVLSTLYNFVILDEINVQYVKDLKNFIYLNSNYSNIFYDIRRNNLFLMVLRIAYHVKHNEMWSILNSYDYKRNLKEGEKEFFIKKFKVTNSYIKLMNEYDYVNRQRLHDMNNNSGSLLELSKIMKMTRKDYMSYEDIVEVNLSKKIIRQLPLLKHVNFLSTFHIIKSEMKRRGFLPGNSSYMIINNWEAELIKDSEKKQQYLNEVRCIG